MVKGRVVAQYRTLAELPGQVYEVALFDDLVDVDQGFDGFALAGPIGKGLVEEQVVLGEPVLQKALAGRGGALVAAFAPGGDGGAEAVGKVGFTGMPKHFNQ